MSITEQDAADLAAIFEVITECCLHDPQWQAQDAKSMIVWHGSRETGPESNSLVIVRLDSGFGLLTQFEDYTGHGCQCGSMTVREPTLHDLVKHLDEYELADVLGRTS